MDFDLPEHIVLLQQTLRRFVSEHAPRELAANWDRDNHFPRDVFEKLGDLGLMGLTVPEDYGGEGRDILATLVVIEELSKRSLALSVPYIMGACYAGMNIVECASETQKRKLLPGIAAGKILFAYGWTEPDIGADVASVRTTAVRAGDEIIINGAKRFCSGADICDFIYTLARSDPAASKSKSLSFVLIPPNTPGVTITHIEALGMKGAATTDVIFSDVRVPAESVVGEENGWNDGWRMISRSGLDVEKLEVAAISLGIAAAAVEDAWAYAQTRRQFGCVISQYQSIRHKLADMQTQLQAARLMTYHAAWLANEGRRCRTETSMAKLFVTEAAKAIVLECQTIFGAYGYVKGFDTERYVRDVLLMPIIGGSSAIQRNNIANWLGLART